MCIIVCDLYSRCLLWHFSYEYYEYMFYYRVDILHDFKVVLLTTLEYLLTLPIKLLCVYNSIEPSVFPEMSVFNINSLTQFCALYAMQLSDVCSFGSFFELVDSRRELHSLCLVGLQVVRYLLFGAVSVRYCVTHHEILPLY